MIKIFIETDKRTSSEYLFVEDLAELYLPQGGYEIVCVGGKDKLKNSTNINLLRKNMLEGGRNLVIFDADSANNGGGYELRKGELEALKDKFGVEFDLFLFPNNHDDGDFESLLEQCINPKHKAILECFYKFEDCVKAHEGEFHYNTPNRKDRVYTYGQIVGGKAMWDFKNEEIWNLNNGYVLPLCEFMKDLI